jgi:hypothetical protein
MYETDEELDRLQGLLDESLARATSHLRSIITPGERTLAARPAVSVAYLKGEEIGVFAHGRAETLNPAGGPDDQELPAVLEHMTAHYGVSPLTWGDVVFYRLAAHWMVAFASDPPRLMAQLPAS